MHAFTRRLRGNAKPAGYGASFRSGDGGWLVISQAVDPLDGDVTVYGSSLVAAEQFGHDVFVGSCAGTSRGEPLVMRRQGSVDLRLLQCFR